MPQVAKYSGFYHWVIKSTSLHRLNWCVKSEHWTFCNRTACKKCFRWSDPSHTSLFTTKQQFQKIKRKQLGGILADQKEYRNSSTECAIRSRSNTVSFRLFVALITRERSLSLASVKLPMGWNCCRIFPLRKFGSFCPFVYVFDPKCLLC